ncbi:MAG: TIGR04255 family protein [Rhodospirillaceae bacterium]
MAKRRHLNKAPIREAVIDIRTAPPASKDEIFALAAKIKERYPTQDSIYRRTFGFEMSADGMRTSQVDGGPAGVRLTSSNEKHIAQLKVDGFTFSRVAPYETWEQMRDEAIDLWSRYVDATGVKKVTRVALRYINVMPLPIPISFEDYLVSPPSIPAPLPQTISGFVSRIVLPDNEDGAVAIITQALEGITDNNAPIVLDIDTFCESERSAEGEQVWRTLDVLRELKNRIFFESITEKTAELFE